MKDNIDERLLAIVADMRKCAPNRNNVWTLGIYNSTINNWADQIEKIVKERTEK